MRHFQNFDKIDSFLKNVSSVLGSKRKLTKTNQIQHAMRHIRRNLLKNLTTFHGGIFELEILEISQQLFVKNYCFNLNIFQVLPSDLIKHEKKSQRRCKHVKIAWQSKRQKKHIEKRERTIKNGKKLNNNKTINLYVVRKNI